MSDTWAGLRRVAGFGGAAAAGGLTRLTGRLADGHAPSLPAAHPDGCPCPVCGGLRTFERPRFFAGQLLTDGDLDSLEQYMLDKHRLHNVHLHGWGVVCGLQVRCDDCGDGLIVESGYAIDPCGNDVIVPVTQRVDVLRLIQQCVQQTAPACDPPRYELPEGCDDGENWCLTVKYREWHTRAVTPLGGAKPAASGSCSCQPSKPIGAKGGCGCGAGGGTARVGWECTCGSGGSANVSTCSCGGSPSTVVTNPECEPTRTREVYEFGVCRTDGSCRDLADRLAGTFPVAALQCLAKLRPVLGRHVTSTRASQLGVLLLDQPAATAAAAGGADPHDSVCSLYDAVLEVYRSDPMRTTCVVPAELGTIDCTPRRADETDEQYAERMAEAARALVLLLVAYVRDCICYHLMPPCPGAPCDDRVILACFTVRDGRVVDICNFDCRRHAGSFVSRNYWLPIGPVISWVVGTLCCIPLVLPSRKRVTRPTERVRSFLAQRRMDSVRKAVVKDDFALVRHWRGRAADLARGVRLDGLIERAERVARPVADGVNLAAYTEMASRDAVKALKAAKVSVTSTRTLEAGEPVPGDLGLFPAATAGDRLVAFERGGRIVGFARDTSPVAPKARRNG